jgi:ABC-type transport system involved in multi-copper enzyme maturation permease subunit
VIGSVNPVLARELKERMRGWWAFVALMGFLGMLTLTVWLVYQANQSGDAFSFDLERQTRVGRDLFEWMLAIMILLICFLVPGLTAGAVAGERERQTLLPLQITLLRPRQILWGKVMAALAYITLLVVASLPIFAIAYQLGGVSLADGARGVVGVLVIAVLLATMTVGISSFAKRVQTATLLGYGFTLVFLLASFIVFAAARLVDDNSGGDAANPPALLLTPNPLVFLADATAGQNVDVGSTPLRPIRQLLVESYDANDGWFTGGQPSVDVGPLPQDSDVFVVDDGSGFGQAQRRGFPAWAISLMWMTALAAILFIVGCRKLRTPAKAER